MLNATQPQNSLSNFRNTSLVIELSKRVWQGLAAYVVKQDYTYPLNQTTIGTVRSAQGRICVQELPLRLVEAFMALLSLSGIALCFIQPGTFHRDPMSLGGHVMILSRSSGLTPLLESHGAASKKTLRSNLSGFLASYSQHLPPDSPAIALQQSCQDEEKLAADCHGLQKWWCPISVRRWFRVCVLIATLGIMVTLEVLLHTSTQLNGLGNVSLDGYSKYTWTLLPTSVLAVIGILFSMIDSTARTLHPFQLLRKGGVTLAEILHDPALQVSLMAVVRAAWKRHFPLLWAILPGLLAPVLTVVTSGLYTVVSVPWTYETELQLKDWFRPENRTIDAGNFNMVKDEGVDEAWTIFNLIQFTNMSYPEWTQGQYAISKFGADNLHSHDGNNSSLYLTARIPAAQAKLNCSLVGHYAGDTYLKITSMGWQDKWLPVDSQPLGCDTSPAWNQTTGHRKLYLQNSNIKSEDGPKFITQGYYLALLDDRYGQLVSWRDNRSIQETTSIHVCGDDRQHYFIGLGYGVETLSLLHCVPYVEALWVTAAFSLPHLSLMQTVPVEPDTGSAVFLSDSASMTAFPHLQWEALFTALMNGSSGIGQLAGLMPGPDDNDASRFITAVEGVLAEYFAQNIHLKYRRPMDGNDNDTTTTSEHGHPFNPDGRPAMGTVTDRSRLRLIQNEVSTRVLQGLLGVMALCMVAETIMVRGGRVIPRDPGSIASRMAYFAGGELWRHVPVGADRWSDEEIIKWGRENCEGGLLLDWWGGDEQEASEDEVPRSSETVRRFAVDSVSRKGVLSGRSLRQQAAEPLEARCSTHQPEDFV